MEKLIWDEGKLGSKYTQSPLTEKDGKVWEDAVFARAKMTDTLADFDDRLAEIIITGEKSLETVPAERLKESIKNVTLKMLGLYILVF